MPYLLKLRNLNALVCLVYTVAGAASLGACGGDDADKTTAETPIVDSGTPAPGTPETPVVDADGGTTPVVGDGSTVVTDGGSPAVNADAGPPRKDAGIGPESITWPSGTDGLDQKFFADFGGWRGKAPTSTWINAHYLPWDWLTAPGVDMSLDGGKTMMKLWDMVKGWDGITVLSMSMAGPDELPVAEYDTALRKCAEGDLDDEWSTFSANAKAAGRNGQNTVVSLAHEFNGTWFQWNPSNVGLEVWFGCWRHIYTAIKSQSDISITWVYSATAHDYALGDYAVASAWDAYPGDEYVDVIGVNRYDFQTLGEKDNTDWRKTCVNPQDLCYAADFARKHNKKLAVPEWSIEQTELGYGDNPAFIEMMHGFFADNTDVLMFESQFNNGGIGYWHLYPVDATNPKSSAKYKELW